MTVVSFHQKPQGLLMPSHYIILRRALRGVWFITDIYIYTFYGNVSDFSYVFDFQMTTLAFECFMELELWV
jgi:hypothetical protein